MWCLANDIELPKRKKEKEMDSCGRAIMRAALLLMGVFSLLGCGRGDSDDAARVEEALGKFKNGTEDECREAAVALGKRGPAAEKALPELYASLQGRELVLFGRQDPFVDAVTWAIARIAKGKVVDHAYALFNMGKGEPMFLLIMARVGDDATPQLCELITPRQDAKTCKWAMTWLDTIKGRLARNRQLAIACLERVSTHEDREVREDANELLQQIKQE